MKNKNMKIHQKLTYKTAKLPACPKLQPPNGTTLSYNQQLTIKNSSKLIMRKTIAIRSINKTVSC